MKPSAISLWILGVLLFQPSWANSGACLSGADEAYNLSSRRLIHRFQLAELDRQEFESLRQKALDQRAERVEDCLEQERRVLVEVMIQRTLPISEVKSETSVRGPASISDPSDDFEDEF